MTSANSATLTVNLVDVNTTGGHVRTFDHNKLGTELVDNSFPGLGPAKAVTATPDVVGVGDIREGTQKITVVQRHWSHHRLEKM